MRWFWELLFSAKKPLNQIKNLNFGVSQKWVPHTFVSPKRNLTWRNIDEAPPPSGVN